MYIHSLDAAEISNLKAISYIYILIDDRDSIALYDDRSMTSAEWTRRQKQRAHLKKIKRKSQFRGKLGRSKLKHSLPKFFFIFVVVKMKCKS